MNKVDVVGYARVSTSKDEQDHSYESQKSYFTEALQQSRYCHFNLLKVYSDKKTATKFKRKGFLEMIEDAGIKVDTDKESRKLSFNPNPTKSPMFKYILVSNLSRFARDLLAVDPIRELRNKGVYIIFLDSGKSTENDEDMMYVEMMMVFAANESRDKSIKMKDALKRTASRGTLMTNGKLFGYDYINGSKELTINEEEAKTVRMIFELYTSGEGFRRITEHYNLKTRNGKQFTISGIKSILNNEKYYGCLVRNKWTDGVVFSKHSPRIRDKSEWKVNEDVIPAIISKETFELAQALRKNKGDGQRGIYKGTGEFVGKIKCEKCGSSYVRNVDRGKLFYICSIKKKKGLKACNSVNLYDNVLEWSLLSWVEDGLKSSIEDLKGEYIVDLKLVKGQFIDKVDNQQEIHADSIRLRLNELKEQRKNLLKEYTKGKFEESELDEIMDEINIEQSALQSQLEAAVMSNDDIHKQIGYIDEVIQKITNFKVRDDYTREDTLSMIDKIVIKQAECIDSGNDLILIDYYFNIFKKLSSISGDLLNSEIHKTFSSISFVWDKTLNQPYNKYN